MIAPTRFRIAVVAPFPHPHLTFEGWMTRIAHIDAQLAGAPRIYLHFSEGHDDSQSAVVEHDTERAEALLTPGGDASTAFVSRLADTVDAFYVHTLHLAEHRPPVAGHRQGLRRLHGVTPEEEGAARPTASSGAVRSGRAGGSPRRGLLHRRQPGHDRALRGKVSVAQSTVADRAGRSELPRGRFVPRAARRRPPPGSAVQRRRAGVAEPGRNAGSGRLAGDAVEFRFILARPRRDPAPDRGAGPDAAPLVDCCSKEDLPAVYEAADLGLILRDDSPVNRVACPTKLAEYLFFGLIPVVRSPRLGDFQELGYAFITEQEFRAGFIPDAASRRWMAEQNLPRRAAACGSFRGRGARAAIEAVGDGRHPCAAPCRRRLPRRHRPAQRGAVSGARRYRLHAVSGQEAGLGHARPVACVAEVHHGARQAFQAPIDAGDRRIGGTDVRRPAGGEPRLRRIRPGVRHRRRKHRLLRAGKGRSARSSTKCIRSSGRATISASARTRRTFPR